MLIEFLGCVTVNEVFSTYANRASTDQPLHFHVDLIRRICRGCS